MKTFSTLLAGALLSASVSAQGVITRQNSGVSHFEYNGNLQLVFDQAEADPGVDTIIVGGGQYTFTDNLFITSPVVLIGSGIRPDSATAYPSKTVFSCTNFRNLFIMDEADSTEIHGIVFRGSIGVKIGNTLVSSDADDVRFIRCEFEYLNLGWGNYGSYAENAYVEHCVIDALDVNQSTDPIISNCVVTSFNGAIASSNCVVRHCMFLNDPVSSNTNVSYQNNVFAYNLNSVWTVTEASTFEDNLFVGNGAGFSQVFSGAAVDGGGNVEEQPMHGTLGAFPNLPNDALNYTTFSFTKDYTIAATYQMMGIYSGSSPWKDGSLPFNPHWTELDSPQTTTVNGTLNGVVIRASAQEN